MTLHVKEHSLSLPFKDFIKGFVREANGLYTANGVSEDDILKLASSIAASKIHNGTIISNPVDAREVIQFHHGNPPREAFGVLFLTARHKVIAYEVLFQGTIDGASVYPREVVKRALANNAAALIICHNHPSGNPEPSEADKQLTQRLKEILAMVDVRILDHFIIGDTVTSFAEQGLL